MTWLKVDDEWANHPKVRRAGLHGRALWIVAASMCASRNTDGFVEEIMVRDFVYFAEVEGDVAIPALVASGLWHDYKTIAKCDRCVAHVGKLSRGSYYFHDWLDYQFTKDEAKLPEARRKKARSKALNRDRKLIAQILDRDGTLCRYCRIRVDFLDRRGPAGGTYDHVDPDGPNTLENVVVSCRQCNNRKQRRTPEEAGMTLLPPGTLIPTQPGPETDLTGADDNNPDPDLIGAAATATGRAGSGLGPGRIGPKGRAPGSETSGRAPAPVAPSHNGNNGNGKDHHE